MPYRQNFPIPDVIDPPRTCLCIEIPDNAQWRAVIAGTLGELRYWYNWERTGDNSGALCAAVWKEVFDSIDWSDMSCCCEDQIPVQYRYSSGGVLQKSDDGGVTWTDAPEWDTRVNSPQFPPITGDDGDDKKCKAATGAAQLLKEQVGDNLSDDMTRAALLAIITGWVTTMIETSNPFEALATVVNNIIFALQIVLLRPALTDDVYHLFACALYCSMADDATFNLAQWNTARTRVGSTIGGIAGTFLERIVYLLGTTGLTNLCRANPVSDGDCSDCECEDSCWVGWSVRPDYGTEISRTATTITVQRNERVPGHFQIWMDIVPNNVNCHKIGMDIVLGGVFGFPCGYTWNEVDLSGAVNPLTNDCAGIFLDDSGAGTITFTCLD